jgi:hypothetical protein
MMLTALHYGTGTVGLFNFKLEGANENVRNNDVDAVVKSRRSVD